MSLFHDSVIVGASGQSAGAASYQISRSLRFNSADSAYLSRTPGSAGNRKTWTWAGWVKKTGSGGVSLLNVSGGTGDLYFDFLFNASEKLVVTQYSTYYRTTTPIYRDPGAWAHIVLAVDTTSVTANNRIRIYVNGLEVTVYDTINNPAQNTDLGWGQASVVHYICNSPNCYLADVHFIDGQALTPSSFGEFDANGVWQPKAYAGTYGTNGFHLDFADNSNNTAATLGKDTSGNGNNWTPNNLSVTAGTGNDSLVDSPTNYGTDTGVGGEVRGNYATWNPALNAVATYTDGALSVTSTDSTAKILAGFGMSSGKWYWEYTIDSASLSAGPNWGFSDSTRTVYASKRASGSSTGFSGVSATTTGTADITSGVVGIALDLTGGTAKIYHNNSERMSVTSIPAGTYFPYFQSDNVSDKITANFGQRPFAYTAPSGYKALCSTNLPTPTILNGATAMDVLTWSGTGATSRSFTGLGFSPDFVWAKIRGGSSIWPHQLYDIVRGAGASKELHSNTTEAEGTTSTGSTASYGYLSSFDANGFSTTGPQNDYFNNASCTYAAWCWDAGSSTVTNTAGTISSQVRANPSAGFSVVTYTGNGTAGATVGHGLGVAPAMFIVKNRGSAGNDWIVYHKDVTGAGDYYLKLSSTGARENTWNTLNDTVPGSSTFTLGNDSLTNGNTGTYVAYCFAPVSGYSAFGSYTGNGSADGPFVYTGFRPRWVMIKQTTTASATNWIILDSSRPSYNVVDGILYASTADAEATSGVLDFASNGFKIRVSTGTTNASSGTYIYAAFAENPFSISRAR